LRQVLWLTACQILFPGTAANALKRDNNNRASDLAGKSLNPEGPYWAQLEGPFKVFMVTLAAQWDTNTPDASIASVQRVWVDSLGQAARRAFATATSSLERSPRTLKALAIAERSFYARLRAAINNYIGNTGGEDIDAAAN
jgi:hypothetical protein